MWSIVGTTRRERDQAGRKVDGEADRPQPHERLTASAVQPPFSRKTRATRSPGASNFGAMALPSTRTGRSLLAARTALGVSTLLAPRLAGRAFFLDPQDNPQLPVIGRMWGIRNLSLAAGIYGATGASRTNWWRLQPVIDGLDFLVIVAEWRRGAVPTLAAGLMAATALVATGLGSLSAAAAAE